MHGRYKGAQMLLVAGCLGIIWTFSAKAPQNIIKPLGLKMCESLCKHTVGCSQYTYIVDDLSCLRNDVNLTQKDSVAEGHAVRSIKVTLQNWDDIKQCPRNDIIFRTRGNQFLCRHSGPKLKKNIEEKLTRLLMFPVSSRKRACSCKFRVKQLVLNNRSVEPFPMVSRAYFTAVAYISTLRKLAIAHTRRFYFLSLKDNSTGLIKEGFGRAISALTVDEVKQMMFVSATIRKHSSHDHLKYNLFSMTTNGTAFRSVCPLPFKTYNIVTDPKRSHIYVLFERKIVKFAYNGTGLETVDTVRATPFMYVDLRRDLLAYVTKRPTIVRQLSLANGMRKMYKLSVNAVSQLYFVGSELYAAPYPVNGTLIIIQNGIKISIKTNFDKYWVTGLLFCGID